VAKTHQEIMEILEAFDLTRSEILRLWSRPEQGLIRNQGTEDCRRDAKTKTRASSDWRRSGRRPPGQDQEHRGPAVQPDGRPAGQPGDAGQPRLRVAAAAAGLRPAAAAAGLGAAAIRRPAAYCLRAPIAQHRRLFRRGLLPRNPPPFMARPPADMVRDVVGLSAPAVGEVPGEEVEGWGGSHQSPGLPGGGVRPPRVGGAAAVVAGGGRSLRLRRRGLRQRGQAPGGHPGAPGHPGSNHRRGRAAALVVRLSPGQRRCQDRARERAGGP
jgi:hypothetical protein